MTIRLAIPTIILLSSAAILIGCQSLQGERVIDLVASGKSPAGSEKTARLVSRADSPSETISKGTRDADGFLVHTVESSYQSAPTRIRVLFPDRRLKENARYPVLYVLPVEAESETRYGDGLLQVKRDDLHNEHDLICVSPEFSQMPWYSDHPTNPRLRQESYFLEVVVPFIDRSYPTTAKSSDRFLVGFSKSGWGAYSILLRHPLVFGRAAAWDAPFMMERPVKHGSGPIFGTQENFENYRIPSLLKKKAAVLKGESRLILLGHGNFKTHHDTIHVLLDELKIPHAYREGPRRKHAWDSGWLSEAVELLVE